MRRLICRLVVVAVLLMYAASLTAFAEGTPTFWEKAYYVDEFELPTDDWYLRNSKPIIGKFSNSATSNSELAAHIFFDEGRISIRLIEYKKNVVKNAYSRDQSYDVAMMDAAGNKYYFSGTMYKKSKDVRFDKNASSVILNAFLNTGTIRFSITDEQLSKYLFSIDLKQTDVDAFAAMLPHRLVGPFSEGLASVELYDMWGYVNTTGKIVIPFQYESAGDFNDGLASVVINGKSGYIDPTGRVVIPSKYESASSFSEGFAKVRLDGMYGFISTTGRSIMPCLYNDAGAFTEGLARLKSDRKWGFIDTTGSWVIPSQYEFAGSFSESLARVESDGRWGYIDTIGNVVVPFQYEFAMPFSEGLASVELNGKSGFIDTKGETVIPFQYESAGSFSEGLASVKMNGRFGFIDTTGQIVIPCQYDLPYPFCDGFAKMELNKKYGFIDTSGNTVVPFQYDNAEYGEGYFTLLKNGELIILDRELNRMN